MKRGVLLALLLLVVLPATLAFDLPEGVDSVDDLPLEVREKLPEDFSFEDIPENFSMVDLEVLAQEHNVSLDDYLGENASQEVLQSLCSTFFRRFDFDDVEIPSYVPFSYDVFNIYTQANQSIAYVVLEDKKIVSVNCSSHPNATYEIFIKDIATLAYVARADYKFDAYRYQKKQGNIQVKGVRFGAMVKTAILHAALGLMTLFG